MGGRPFRHSGASALVPYAVRIRGVEILNLTLDQVVHVLTLFGEPPVRALPRLLCVRDDVMCDAADILALGTLFEGGR